VSPAQPARSFGIDDDHRPRSRLASTRGARPGRGSVPKFRGPLGSDLPACQSPARRGDCDQRGHAIITCLPLPTVRYTVVCITSRSGRAHRHSSTLLFFLGLLVEQWTTIALDTGNLLSDLLDLGGSDMNREVDRHVVTLTRRQAGNPAMLALDAAVG